MEQPWPANQELDRRLDDVRMAREVYHTLIRCPRPCEGLESWASAA